MSIIKYNHHGVDVCVREDLKGKHREYCLCWKCALMKDKREENCKIANLLFAVCCECNITTPVFECPAFIEKK